MIICFPKRAFLLLIPLFLAACGGGSGGGSVSGSPLGSSSGLSTTTGSATLSWNAVTSTPVSGYRIYYGTSPGVYQQSPGQGLNVGNVTTYTIQGLAAGKRYYFAVTSYDASNNESGYSSEIYKDIS